MKGCLLFKQAYGFSTVSTSRVLERTFKRTIEAKQYAKAVEAAMELADLYKREYGTEHLRYAKGLLDLGFACKELGEWAKAEKSLREASSSFSELAGPSHRATITSLRLLAEVYETQSQPAAALPIYKTIADSCTSLADAREQARAYTDLGSIHNTLQQYAEAVGPLTRSLETIQKHYGANNLLAFDPRLQLIKAYNRQSLFNEALGEFNK
jgi:tetratricopeptide (TPR) repeat protein